MDAIEAALVWLGSRIVWDALAAIGTVGALLWAVMLSNRQAADARRRDAAHVKACMLVAARARERLTEALKYFDENATFVSKEVGRAPPEVLRGMDLRRCALDECVRARHWFANLDLLGLPSTGVVDVVIDLPEAFEKAEEAVGSLRVGQEPRLEQRIAIANIVTFTQILALQLVAIAPAAAEDGDTVLVAQDIDGIQDYRGHSLRSVVHVLRNWMKG